MVTDRVGLIDETRLGIILVKSANYESVRGLIGFRMHKYKFDLLLTSKQFHILRRKMSHVMIPCFIVVKTWFSKKYNLVEVTFPHS